MNRTKWKDIRPNVGPVAEERIKRERGEILLDMNLREIREHVSDLTQTDIGELLEVSQAAVSQLERRQDAAVSSIARFIATLGGQLELVAVFPNQQIRVTQFENIKGQLLDKVQEPSSSSKR
jgi:predicted transcriptional regulator